MFNPVQLLRTIDNWIQFLDQYNMEQLRASPGAGKWSLGQLYIHLVRDSDFYIEQALLALGGNAHVDEGTSAEGNELFHNNAFPNRMIEGHPSNAFLPQPNDKEELTNGLLQLQHNIRALILQADSVSTAGKSKHPGFGYLNANEWLHVMDMHFRHHLHQKQRIDHFLYGKQAT